MRCSVRGCRFPETHVSAGHRCGICGESGHGQVECGNVDMLRVLALDTERLPPREGCAVVGCLHTSTHRTAAHHCAACGQRGGGRCTECTAATDEPPADACARLSLRCSIRCPICRTPNLVDLTSIVYTTDSRCSVCFEAEPLVVMPTCRHACVCAACAREVAAR